jgi:putative protease
MSACASQGMKIVAPVRSVDEVEMLLSCGADELYCGYTPEEWRAHSAGLWWVNRRDPRSSDFTRREHLLETIRLAHEGTVPVYVTVNAPFYPAGALPYLVDLCERLIQEYQADGLIVADLDLILSLGRRLGSTGKARIHLSNLGGCYNHKSAEFFSSLGLERIILSRHMRRSEIERLVREAPPGIGFEVFALNDGCYFEEAYCRVSHSLGGPFCLGDWTNLEPCGPHAAAFSARLERERACLERYLWYQNNCGSSFQGHGLPNGPCSLCWFGFFRDWGVSAVKIVGREASFHRKMASLQLVKAIVDLARAGAGHEEIAEAARSFRATPELCDSGFMCYYGGA